jgi:translation initiation factor IF-2
VKDLAEKSGISPIDVIKQLMRNGIMASMNNVIDFDVALLVTSAFGIRARPPVVTMLGHVDHGKTSLLDAIRATKVVDAEVGHITQRIGAYQINHEGQKITFLDTPGHEAFTAIRARGARVTDIAVLVVAADDGMMPQTLEAISHAKAAEVPIVAAINKMDRPDADPDRVKRQMAEQNMLVEDWGGEVIAVPVSATTGEGIPELMENLLLVAELAELKANPHRSARGVIIEAKLDRNRGPLATVLVQSGTLNIGDHIVAGTARGRVRALADDTGKRMKSVEPAQPAEVMGFGSLPDAGDLFTVVTNERESRALAEERQRVEDAQRSRPKVIGPEDVHTGVALSDAKELNLILKADVQGSVEAARASLEKLDEDGTKVRVLHAASGTITESDVLLASASNALVVGFATSPEPGAERVADRERVQIKRYDIIYHMIEDIEVALKGMQEPVQREVVTGAAEIRAVFSASRAGKIAGCMITEGRITRGARVRVLREGAVIHEGGITSLRHFREDVNEMGAGTECGIGLGNYGEFEEGDVIQAYRRERTRGT